MGKKGLKDFKLAMRREKWVILHDGTEVATFSELLSSAHVYDDKYSALSNLDSVPGGAYGLARFRIETMYDEKLLSEKPKRRKKK